MPGTRADETDDDLVRDRERDTVRFAGDSGQRADREPGQHPGRVLPFACERLLDQRHDQLARHFASGDREGVRPPDVADRSLREEALQPPRLRRGDERNLSVEQSPDLLLGDADRPRRLADRSASAQVGEQGTPVSVGVVETSNLGALRCNGRFEGHAHRGSFTADADNNAGNNAGRMSRRGDLQSVEQTAASATRGRPTREATMAGYMGFKSKADFEAALAREFAEMQYHSGGGRGTPEPSKPREPEFKLRGAPDSPERWQQAMAGPGSLDRRASGV
jgi:hypothetical protein